MAHGDEYTIDYGPFKGCIKRSIDIAAGTSTIDLIAGVANQRIRLHEMLLTIEGEAQVDIVEETTGDSLSGPYNVVTDATAGVVKIEDDEGVESQTKGEGIQASRSASVGLSGWAIYKRIDTGTA